MTSISLSSVAIALGVGTLSGAHTAIWGMYKDAIHEGFFVRRFARSIIVGASVAVVIALVLELPVRTASGLLVLFGLAYAAERGVVEVWKTFVREEDQSKYTIPMQFSVHGVPVAGRRLRLAAGAGYVVIVALCLVAIGYAGRGSPGGATALKSAFVGLTVGSIIAFGGAWKDAPTEGFDPLKFFRSPCLTVLFAMLLAHLTDSYLQIAVASIGYERATAETYKTFFFPTKPRGKFAGKPILFPSMMVRRQYFVPAYVAIWVAVIATGAIALHGTARRDERADRGHDPGHAAGARP
jgi:hypothetical protein